MLLKFPKSKFKLWLNKFGYKTATKIASKPKCQLYILKQTAAKERNSIIYALQLALGGPQRVSQGAITAPRSVIRHSKSVPHDAITSTVSWRFAGTSSTDMGSKAGAGSWVTMSALGLCILSLFVLFLLKHHDRIPWKEWKVWDVWKGGNRCERCEEQIKEKRRRRLD